MSTLSAEAVQERLEAIDGMPAVTVTGLVHQTGKSVLAAGVVDHRPVMVKLLVGDDAFWSAKLAHEIDVYQAFTTHRPPIRVPELVHTDGHRVLVLERMPGRALHPDRYPTQPLAEAEVEIVLATIRRLNEWSPPEGVFIPVFDYPERVRRYHTKGFLTGAEADTLARLIADLNTPSEINHGDPLPPNLLIGPDGVCTPLDWEFTGLFLPGFDLALLHGLLVHTPRAQHQIERIIATAGLQVPFTINQAMVLTRELRTHQELPAGRLRQQRLQLLNGLWQRARQQLAELSQEEGC